MRRLTPLRQKIWDLLCQYPQPLTAYQLVDLYEKKWLKPIHAMSVYRCLDFFIAEQTVHKIQSLNSFIVMQAIPDACNAIDERQPAAALEQPQLLVCDQCHQVFATALPMALLQQLQQSISHSFQLQLSGMELHGCCRNCTTPHDDDQKKVEQ